MATIRPTGYLAHYGVKGMKWREKHVVGTASDIYKHGRGLGSGPVGGDGNRIVRAKQYVTPTKDALGLKSLYNVKKYQKESDINGRKAYSDANLARDLDAESEYNKQHPEANGRYKVYDTSKLKQRAAARELASDSAYATAKAYKVVYDQSLLGKASKIAQKLRRKNSLQLIRHCSETGGEILIHYGTPGQKWGKRLYQNKDGSLTALGRIHYGVGKRKEVAASKKADEEKAARAKKLVETRQQQNEVTKAVKSGASKEEIEALIAKYGKKAITKAAVKASSDPDFVNEHRDKLTNAEISEKIARFQAEQNLSRYKTTQKEESTANEPVDDRKQRIIQSGDPETILKNAASLSSAELREAKDRISQLKEIRGMTMAEVSAKKSPVVKKGSTLIREIIAPAAKEQAKTLATAGMKLAGKAIIESAFDKDDPRQKTLLKAIGVDLDAEAEKIRAKEVTKVVQSNDLEKLLAISSSMTNAEVKAASERVGGLSKIQAELNKRKNTSGK